MVSYTHAATLVSNPQYAVLDDALTSAAREALDADTGMRWLAAGIAADVLFAAVADADPKALADTLKQALAATPVDVIVQPLATRQKKLFLADMDSTIIGQECIDELADMVGLKPHVAAITERAMRGEIEFEPALRERVDLLKGLDVRVVDKVIDERITLNPGARTLIQTLRARGIYTMLVSGGFTLFTSRIADRTGFHENRANTLLVEDRRFSGSVHEPILGRQAKLDALVEMRGKLALQPSETMAIGDGANDLAMLDEAGLGFAYHAKPAVAAAADARIDHSDLTAVLYALGIPADEFVT